MGFLAVNGDYGAVMELCGVKNQTPGFEARVSAAESEVVRRCGPVLQATVTDVLDYDETVQILSARVATLTSVTGADGTEYDPADFLARGQALTRKDGDCIPSGTVVYTSGWAQAEIPPGLIEAGSLLARHLVRNQLGNQRISEDGLTPGSAWLWPRQAELLAADYFLAPIGFA